MPARFAIVLTLLLAAGAAAAKPPIGTNDYIWGRLFAAAVGHEIRDKCPTISARMLVVIPRALALKNHAHSLGYTDEEIDDFLNDTSEQDRMRRQAYAYMERRGVVKGEPETYCRLGEAEIDGDTFIGSMLRKD